MITVRIYDVTRILVVEDGKNLAFAIQRGLEGEEFKVDLAFDGTEGLSLATDRSYDAIVLDVMLPGIDGYEVCSTLRAAANWTPILMLTAKDTDLDHVTALETGADDYLPKPFSYAVLIARLRALLRRGGQRPPALEVGDLRLDPVSHRCWRGETPIDLTPREFALLGFLMRRPDEVLSKAEILDQVWDFTFHGDPNIVEVYVGYLRRKIDVPFGRQSIQTIRLVGYRLEAD
jgi:two-component system OmpR family response regulator